MKKITGLLVFLFCFVALTGAGNTAAAPTMTKDELKALLGSDDLVILDVRQDKDWSSSEHKIKDAIRVENGDLSLTKRYKKDSVFVLYCS